MGGLGGNGSGDIFLAFSTANKNAFSRSQTTTVQLYPNDQIGVLFAATVEATEEAITNALFAARTMQGINGNTIYELPKERVVQILREYNRIH
jgi:L-aminopeptidase/D-esterase-like protein